MANLPQINVKRLRINLCGSDKMPLNFTYHDNAELHDRRGNSLGVFIVKVNAGIARVKGFSTHRIFIYCNCCGKWQSVGRIQQHRGYQRNKPQDYRYLTCKTLNNGIVLKLTKEGRKQLKYWQGLYPEWNDTTLFCELCTTMISVSPWEFVTPEDIGALTSCPILLSEDVKGDDRGTLTAIGKLYWHASYERQLACEALTSKEGLYLALASEYPNGPNNAYHDGIADHNKGVSTNAGPYNLNTHLGRAWLKGWQAANEAARGHLAE